jgi:hypothetical protein
MVLETVNFPHRFHETSVVHPTVQPEEVLVMVSFIVFFLRTGCGEQEGIRILQRIRYLEWFGLRGGSTEGYLDFS